MIRDMEKDKNLIELCLKEALLMQGHLNALQDEKKAIIEKVEKAKKWIAKQPDYQKFLQHLQNILHQKNIGAFSELLSFFVRDVLQKDKEIFLELYTFRNLPALRIEAQNPNIKDGKGRPFRESIYEGNGGSIANIVSTGIRLIALSRLNHRKFIILDEPDCWLAPHHVPIFARIIGEISEKLDIQTVIISHHHWHYFKDYGRVIELKSDGVHLTTEVLHDTPFDNISRNVINKVIMRRFMSHYDTQFDLHPHLTCIVGENDIGKSVLATALKSVAYGDSSDSYIMHNEGEAQVLIELSTGIQILWQRVRETTQDFPQKVKFSLYQNGTPVGPGEYNSSETPAFISKELNILTTEDIDVHIGNQKDPVFLLSNQVKPQERAKILSLGKESLIIQKMMENIKQKAKDYNKEINTGEARFTNIEKQIQILANIKELVDMAENLKTDHYFLEKQVQSTEELQALLNEITLYEPVAKAALIAPVSIREPVIQNVALIEEMIQNIAYYRQISSQEKLSYQIESIALFDDDSLNQAIKQLHRFTQYSQLQQFNVDISPIELRQVHALEDAIMLMQKVAYAEKLEKIDIAVNKPEILDIQTLNTIINDMDKCAVLGQMPLLETGVVKPELSSNQNDLLSLIANMESVTHSMNELAVKEANVNQWKVIIEKEMEDYLSQVGHICPTCHQHIDKEHLLGEKHA
jgi:hypothetical protein